VCCGSCQSPGLFFFDGLNILSQANVIARNRANALELLQENQSPKPQTANAQVTTTSTSNSTGEDQSAKPELLDASSTIEHA